MNLNQCALLNMGNDWILIGSWDSLTWSNYCNSNCSSLSLSCSSKYSSSYFYCSSSESSNSDSSVSSSMISSWGIPSPLRILICCWSRGSLTDVLYFVCRTSGEPSAYGLPKSLFSYYICAPTNSLSSLTIAFTWSVLSSFSLTY
jgi:hypothetical protein